MSGAGSPGWGDDESLARTRRCRAETSEATTARYEIHIKGRVGDDLTGAFEGLRAEVQPVETVLHGELPDQAALHGMLERVQALGLELMELRRLPGGDENGGGDQPA